MGFHSSPLLQEVGPDPEHMYNCHVIISSTGRIQAAYRKVHLFDVSVPNGPILMESRRTAPGNEVSALLDLFTRLGDQHIVIYGRLYSSLHHEVSRSVLLVSDANLNQSPTTSSSKV